MDKKSFDNLRINLSVESKNGLDFILSASIIWLLITYVWTLDLRSYDKSIITFMVGALLIPLAYLFSKIFKSAWTLIDNPLQSLGLWLNFAQLFYFPFLIFFLLMFPDYFIMGLAIITGAHLFPYAWFYKTYLYAVFAGLLSIGAMCFGLFLPTAEFYLIPMFMSVSFIILTVLLFFDSKMKRRVFAQPHNR